MSTAITVDQPTLFDGFLNATERFRTAVDRGDGRLAYYATFEALNWVVSLDDLLKTTNSKWRGRHDRDILRAVRFARNRTHHQWANALWTEPLIVLNADTILRGDTLLGDVHSWLWRSATDLPLPDKPQYSDRRGQAAYESLLAGQPLTTTLESLTRVLSAAISFAHASAAKCWFCSQA